MQKNLGEQGEQESRMIIYVIDEIIQRATLLKKRFPFLEENAEFMTAFNTLCEMGRNLPGSVEDIREPHSILVEELRKASEGTQVHALHPSQKTVLAVPEEIADFDEILKRVSSLQEGEDVDDAISSATDAILANEIPGGSDNIVLKYRQEVRAEVVSQIKLLFPNYEADNEDKKTPAQVVETIGDEGIFEFLKKTSEELETLAEKREDLEPFIDLILDVREHVEEGFLIGAPTKQKRVLEANRILYEKIETAPIEDLSPEDFNPEDLSPEDRAKILKALGQLTAREEQIIRMLRGIAGSSDEPLDRFTGKNIPEATRERIAQIEAEALRRTGITPPHAPKEGKDGQDTDSPNDGSQENLFGNGVISIAAFKRRRGQRSKLGSNLVARRAHIREK